MNELRLQMANSAVNGALSVAMTGGIILIISLIYFHFYKKSSKYQEFLKDEELKKQDDIENQKTELLIKILEKEKQS